MADPIITGQMTAGTVALQVDGMSVSPAQLYIHNMDTTKSLFIGGADVTIANGFAIDKSSTQDFLVYPDQGIYVVSDSGSHLISWMRIPV